MNKVRVNAKSQESESYGAIREFIFSAKSEEVLERREQNF
jgi:hypothetical protein